jgi:hypothetical protein
MFPFWIEIESAMVVQLTALFVAGLVTALTTGLLGGRT